MHLSAIAVVVANVLGLSPLSAKPLRWIGPLDEAQVIARAQVSFGARLAALNAKIADERARSTRALALPQVSVSESTLKSTLAQLGMPAARQTYASLNATVPLFAPQAWAAARAAGSNAVTARAIAAMSVSRAVSDALVAYNAAALARAIEKLRAVDVSDQRSHLAFTLERVQSGAAPRYLIARDEAAVAQARQFEEESRFEAVRAAHALDVQLNFDVRSKPVLTLGVPEVPTVRDVAALERRAYAQRPDVIAAERSLFAARERIAAARDGYLPTISATVQTYNGTSNPALGKSGSQIGITASLPLFDGGSRGSDIRRAELEYDRTRVELGRTKLQVQADVLDALSDMEVARRDLAAASSGLRNAKIDMRITDLRARAGKGIELDVLDALATLAHARENVLRATARYDDSLVGLRAAVGDYAPHPF